MAQVKQKPYGDTNLAEIPKMETLNWTKLIHQKRPTTTPLLRLESIDLGRSWGIYLHTPLGMDLPGNKTPSTDRHHSHGRMASVRAQANRRPSLLPGSYTRWVTWSPLRSPHHRRDEHKKGGEKWKRDEKPPLAELQVRKGGNNTGEESNHLFKI
jgi:hypothetical protein